jgi:acyl-ACP thioesterase
MTDLKDNSLNYFFENLEALFFDYIKRYFDIDLSYFVANLKKVDRSKNFLAQDVKYKKLERTLKMFKAY